MNLILTFIDFFLHLDKHLGQIIQDFGVWTYLIFFLVIFCETGLVVTPFLPGDSLLFAIGSFCALGDIDLVTILVTLCVAAVLGNIVNYSIGRWFGPKVFGRFINQKHMDRTQKFYEKHGGKTIIITRFAPILRTFAPFVAGIGKMSYARFLTYNIIGGATWVCAFTLCGYWFGNMPAVKENFTLVIMAIIVISLIPAVVEYIRARRES